MKEYPQKYENFYTDEKRLSKSKIEHVTTDIGLEGLEYAELLRKNVLSFEKEIFKMIVKYTWLTRRFHYKGEGRTKGMQNGIVLDGAYSVFMKHQVGTGTTFMQSKLFNMVRTYIEDMFVDFDARNPFEEEMEYPFKNIGLSYLCVVYNMDERMDLLNLAESRKMDYSNFVDYVINYIGCYNEDIGKEKYRISFHHYNIPYVIVEK